jgi:subtilisin family serine protease
MKRFIFLLIFVSFLFSQKIKFEEKIEPSLIEKLSKIKDDEFVNIVVYLGPYDYDFIYTLPTPEDRINYMKKVSYETQKPILNFLIQKGWTDSLIQLWLANKIGVRVPKKGIFELLEKFPQIKYIYWNIKKVKPLPMNVEPLSNFFPGEDYVSGSVLNVKADEAWRRGYKGKGIIIGHLDTGVDVDHPVLKNSYRGIFGWYDPINNTTTPNDPDGHGTGSLSLAVGSNGIGVAPGAKWIASNGILGTSTQLSQSMQWFAGLADSLRPHLITNSWGSSTGSTTEWWDEIQGWLAVGIIPVFAIGNEGPDGSTTSSPGDYPMVFGIGGTYWPSEEIIWYSSRGPAPDQAPWNNTSWWPRNDWNRHKPDLIAPSEPTVAARTMDDNLGQIGYKWQSFGGTSAACPHAAGVLALLLQANTFKNITSTGYDTARIRRIYKYMTDYAYWNSSWGNPSNTPGLRDTFGWGRVDAEKYISNLPEPQVPHIFIDTVYVLSTTDGDKDIEPAENIQIRIRLKNTGANATSVTGKITYRTNTNISTGVSVSFGNIPRFSSSEATITLTSTSSLPQNTRIYFTFKITATGYTKHDFFYLDTYKADIPSQRVWLYFHDGSAANAYNDIYMAQRFTTPVNDTIISVRVLMYQGAGAQCILYVWNDNNGVPGSVIYQQNFILNNVYPYWQQIDIPASSRPVVSGTYWVGFYTAGSGAPYSIMDGNNNPSGLTAYSDNGTTWETYDVEEYMLEVYVGRTGVTTPDLYIMNTIIDDSRFGNGDGILEPGEKVGLAISLSNRGRNVWNLQGVLSPADQQTADHIQIIKNTANFGNVPFGENTGNNYNDMWEIRYVGEVPIYGYTYTFNVNFTGTYNNNQTFNKTISFSITAAFAVPDSMEWFYESGWSPGNFVAYYYDPCDYQMFREATSDLFFGLSPLDSFKIDTIGILYFSKSAICNNTDNPGEMDARIRVAQSNGLPGAVLWSQSSPNESDDRSFIRFSPGNVMRPGWIWLGWYNTATQQEQDQGEYNTAATHFEKRSELYPDVLSQNTLIDIDGNGSWDWIIFAPIPFWAEITHYHPCVSFYRPDGWDWPLVPSNTQGNTTVPSILLPYDWKEKKDTTWISLTILNRQSIDIAAPPQATSTGARGVWDNYLFLDNIGFWNLQVNQALPKWTYLYTTSGISLLVPGGRHTILFAMDWNNEVGGNIFNEMMRYWGMQFSWNANDLYARNAPKRIKWVPDLTGPFAGPYYNATVYACLLRTSSLIPNYGKPWHAVGIRNFNLTWDNDLDLRLYSDEPNDPYSGYTNVIEASELGPGKVDYIMMDGHHLSTKYYAGVYSFISPQNSRPDSTWMQFEMARYVITTGTQWNYLDDNFTDSTILHVYDVIINNGQTFSCTLITLSGNQDFGIALYRSTSEDRFKRRIDYLVASDVIAPGKEYITYTNTGANDTFGLIVYGNLNSSGTYRLKFLGTAQPLGIMEEEFYAEVVREGIILKWGNIEGAKEFYVEKLNNKGYERIAKIYPPQNEYLDKDVKNGKEYTYRLIINYGDKQKILGPITILYITPLPSELTILKIDKVIKKDGILKVAVPENEKIEILIYDVSGRISQTIFKGFLPMGIYEFNLKKNSKGVYFVVLRDKKKEIREKVIFF